jgi:hypothetical protein
LDDGLNPLNVALARVSDAELRALIDATNKAPQIAPGLLAWIESARDWELNRRQGLDYSLRPPEAAIPPEEDAVSIDAAMILRAQFAQVGVEEFGAVVVLFDAIVGLLTGAEHRPSTRIRSLGSLIPRQKRSPKLRTRRCTGTSWTRNFRLVKTGKPKVYR